MTDEPTTQPGADQPDDRRLPPSPPALSRHAAAIPADTDAEGESDEEVLALSGGTEWLDPEGRRSRKRTPPKGPIDRLKRKWRRWRRHRRRLAAVAPWYRPRNVVLAIALLVVIGVMSVLLAAYIRVSDIRRAPLLPVTAAPASIGTNILLLSSNGQSAALGLDPNTMVVEFIHLSANYGSGQVIDLPRDLILGTGTSATTVGSVYQHFGAVGLVTALEKDMGVTVNHVIQTSFGGYAQVTDKLGGLSITTDTGKQRFTGAQAQAYAAQPNPAGGTIETGHRFQHWSKAMLTATLQPGVLLNPFTLWSIFADTADNIVVDDTLGNGGLISLAWHVKSLGPGSLHFFTAPNGGYGTFHGAQVLLSNPAGFAQLSTAIRTDNLATIGLFQ